MNRKVFEKICRIVHERSGISLSDSKEALVSARLGKRMRALGIRDFKAYLARLLEDPSGEEVVQLLDAISTNVTSFFREPEHFEFLKKAVLGWVEKGQRRFRFWSAASSTGEEPFSLAMTLLEALGDEPVDLKILATDISTRVLEKCKDGAYDQKCMSTVPRRLREKHFDRIREGDEVLWKPRAILRDLVTFARLNLAAPPFPMRGPFDAVLCRNVMIYFDDAVKRNLIAEFHRLLRPEGYLIVGHSESLSSIAGEFKALRPSLFMKVAETVSEKAGAKA